jgi:divalent metal cation (Fe/Co/Zn/Cd) transporter
MERGKWVRWVIALSIFTIAYNLAEGAVAIYFGINDEAMALFGFGVDSLLEAASALLVIWRFKKEFESSEKEMKRERIANIGIGILYLILTASIVLTSASQLLSKTHPVTTFPGIIISLVSLSFMFMLWKAKLRAADALQSKTVRNDAGCSLACIKLSFILFAGSVLFFYFPALWWIDSASALLLAYFIGKEGWEIVGSKGDESCSGCGCHE